jgi:hypothetical protein
MTAHPTGRRLAHLLAVLVFCFAIGLVLKLDPGTKAPRLAATSARAATEVESGELGQADIQRAIDSIATLGTFYDRLANNDPNRHAAAFWAEMEAHYVRAGFALDDLLRRGRIRIESLGEGRDSSVEGGEIVIDGRLGGRWQAEFVRNTRRIGNDDWGYISLLSTALLENLHRLEPDAELDWFKSHQSRSGFSDVAKLPRDSDLARLLARFWHLKDKYLWSAMSPAESGGERRLREGRKVDLFSEMTAVAQDAERHVAPAWKDRLTSDWHDYDRMVIHFSTNRAWLAAAAPSRTAAPRPSSKRSRRGRDPARKRKRPWPPSIATRPWRKSLPAWPASWKAAGRRRAAWRTRAARWKLPWPARTRTRHGWWRNWLRPDRT